MATATYREGSLGPRPTDGGTLQSPAVVRISWSAIFAGVVVAVAIQLVLSMLGVGIGLGLVDPGTGSTPEAGSFGIGAGLWWLVSNLLALVAGGYVAAWLAGNTLRFDGVLHGVVTWGITLMLTFYLLGSAIGGIIGGAFGMVGSATSGAASMAADGIKAAAPQMIPSGTSPDQIMDQAKSYLQPSDADPATLSPEQAQQEIAATIPKVIAGGDQAQPARDRIVAIMAAQLKISPDEAGRRFDEAQAQAMQAKDQAMQAAKTAADQTASAGSKASVLAFAALVLGAAAAAIGGSMAVQRRGLALAPAARA